jgi:hypothetical protein
MIDLSKVNSVEVDGIDYSDYPDFCDAYISNAWYGDRPMTDEEIDELNENTDFVYEQVEKYIY